MLAVIKVIVTLVSLIVTGVICEALGVDGTTPFLLVIFGNISMFLGPKLADASGFYVGHSFVSGETPVSAWRLFGVLFWLGAAGSILWMRFHRA